MTKNQYIRKYTLRMLYVAPKFIIDAIVARRVKLEFKKDTLVLSPNKHLDPIYPEVKQWVERYVSMTPMENSSVFEPIVYH